MTITASAPGKLILLGEYAVLDGAPALVAAIDRRANVCIDTPDSDTQGGSPDHGDIRVAAGDLGIDARASVTPDGAIMWRTDPATAAKLHLVESVLTATYRAAAIAAGGVIRSDPDSASRGYLATLSTAAFFDATGSKLGLGSSAALTVALAGALRADRGLPAPTLPELVALHRSMQGGRGSGADIGAALTGGTVVYAGGDTDHPSVAAARLPHGVHWCCVFTGRSTATPQFLARLADWRRGNSHGYRARIAGLAEIAADGVAAANADNPAATLDAVDAYAAGLDALGTDAGIDIMSAEHREIRNVAGRCGVIYKPSGAGGGDIGVGFSGDPSHIDALRRGLSGTGYRIIDMSVDPQGLVVRGRRSLPLSWDQQG